MKTNVYNLQGKVTGQIDLSDAVFAVAVKPTVVQQAVKAQLANLRSSIAHTKTRAEVRGGGKKPWKQKGTGRARHGSSRSPIWVGGGVTFGPRNERNFSEKINKKTKIVALQMALSDKASHEHIVVVENINLKSPKTKELVEIMNLLPTQGKKALVALPGKCSELVRAAKNLKKFHVTNAASLNVVDVLKYEYLVLDSASLETIEKTYNLKK